MRVSCQERPGRSLSRSARMGQGLRWEPALGSKLRPRVISLLCDCSEVPEPQVPNRNLPEQLWEVLTGQSPGAVHTWALYVDTRVTPSHSIPGREGSN